MATDTREASRRERRVPRRSAAGHGRRAGAGRARPGSGRGLTVSSARPAGLPGRDCRERRGCPKHLRRELPPARQQLFGDVAGAPRAPPASAACQPAAASPGASPTLRMASPMSPVASPTLTGASPTLRMASPMSPVASPKSPAGARRSRPPAPGVPGPVPLRGSAEGRSPFPEPHRLGTGCGRRHAHARSGPGSPPLPRLDCEAMSIDELFAVGSAIKIYIHDAEESTLHGEVLDTSSLGILLNAVFGGYGSAIETFIPWTSIKSVNADLKPELKPGRQ